MATWNTSCCLRLLWLLFFQSGSVWVAWFKSEILDESLSNYWMMKTSPQYSWFTNKIREVVFTWIKLKVGNGRLCRFWSDNWSPFGFLEKYLLRGTTLRSGNPPTAALSDLFVESRSSLPPIEQGLTRGYGLITLFIFFCILI